MGMKLSSSIEVFFESEQKAKAAKLAISHEGNVGRAKVTFNQKGTVLTITISSEDVVAFRATVNALLRALGVFEGLETSDQVR